MTEQPHPEPPLFPGNTEMHRRVSALDWSQTSVGPYESWPLSLRTLVRTLLVSQYPMILTWGPDYIQFYNDAYAKLIGSKHPEALGIDIRITLAEAWSTLGPMIERVMANGEANWTAALLLLLERSGYREEAYFSVSHAPAYDDSGVIRGMHCVCSEVTQQIISERRLKLLSDLATHLGESHSVESTCRVQFSVIERHPLDTPFAFLYLREADGQTLTLAARAGLVEAGDVIPQQFLLNSDTADVWQLKSAAAGVPAVIPGIDQLLQVSGGPFGDAVHTAVSLPVSGSSQESPIGVMVAGVSPNHEWDEVYSSFFQLLTGQVSVALRNARAYEEEKQRAEALAEIDRAKTEFFSNVSHEFRTPLTLMLGPLEEILGQGEEHIPGEHELLAVAHRNGQRLLRLVNALLSFSRLEAGRAEATYEPTDLGPFTADLVSTFRSATERAGLKLTVVTPTLLEPVFVDRDMWEKIVLNLVSNAFKYTFEGEISVRLRQTDGHAELEVRDTGTGIPEADLPRLFQRFHRVRGARGRSYEGTGIGLSLVQELVQLHGGEVSVQSELGSGSTFKVRLPLGHSHLPADTVQLVSTPIGASHSTKEYGEEALRWLEVGALERDEPPVTQPFLVASGPVPARVLLADDNADMRGYVRRLLEDRFIVEAVGDGEAALRAIEQNLPDLILTDIMMPGLDGFGLLRALRGDARTRDIPVILLSARAGEEARVEGLERGADDYLVKPFRARELQARVEANLRISLARREATHRQIAEILESITDAFYALDSEWRFTYVNHQFESYYQLDRASLLGKVIWDEFPAARGTESDHRFRQVMETRVSDHFETYSNVSLRWLEVHVYPAPSGIAVYFRDISERKNHEQEREGLLQEAQEASRLKDEFLATVSHELRTPLTAIMGWANILLTQPNDPATQRAVESIHRNARGQSQIIEDILDISRIVTGRMRLDMRFVQLGTVLETALDAVRPGAEAKGIRLRIVMDPQVGPIMADPDRLQQVFWNLLSNAVKFTPKNGKIHIQAVQDHSSVLVSIADNGQGIDADFLPYVFDRFRQADMSSTRSYGGLGLGLSIVRQLVEMHGGTVAASSSGLGAGSTFTVRLPLAPLEVETGAPLPGALEVRPTPREGMDCPPELQGLDVLIVDDEPDTRDVISVVLTTCGATVRSAASAEEALAEYTKAVPHVFVSDIGMPQVNGYELIRQVRALEKERGLKRVPALALTAYARAEDRLRALNAGYQMHATKPVAPAELVTVVASLAGWAKE